MSDFSELVKNFDKIRNSLRSFYIFGDFSREKSKAKSSRSYDNELRRIKSWLKDIVKSQNSTNGKSFCISVDPSAVDANPLYSAFKSKSFTDNDVTFHFLIIDLLTSNKELTIGEISDLLTQKLNDPNVDPQTVRNKLKEYTELGIVNYKKTGKSFYYSLADCTLNSIIEKSHDLQKAISFFSEIAPIPVVGSFIQNKYESKNTIFSYKHNFMAGCLDASILLVLLEAMHKNCFVKLENYSERLRKSFKLNVFPIKIFVSLQTGRQYLLGLANSSVKFTALRLDYIQKVEIAQTCENAEEYRKIFEASAAFSFGTNIRINGKRERLEMLLHIDEEREQFILDRIKREGRGGSITKINPNVFSYKVETYDSQELMPWVKSFIGRIIKLSGDNKLVINRFYHDMEELEKLYEN